MSEMDLFKTRAPANEGQKFFLVDPGTGEKTDHWLLVLSQWSDAFQEAKTEALKEAHKRSLGLSDDKAVAVKQEELTAALVGDWSFDQECTRAAVVEFLREAPQIADQVDRLASDDARFFGKPSGGSKPGQKRK